MNSTCMPSSTPRSTVSLSSRASCSRYGRTTVGRSRLAIARRMMPGPRCRRPVATSVKMKSSCSSAPRMRWTVVRGRPERATSSLNVSPPEESAASSRRIVAARASTWTPLRCSFSSSRSVSITCPPSSRPRSPAPGATTSRFSVTIRADRVVSRRCARRPRSRRAPGARLGAPGASARTTRPQADSATAASGASAGLMSSPGGGDSSTSRRLTGNRCRFQRFAM